MIEKIVTGTFFTNTYIISNHGKCVIVDPGLDFKEAAEELKRQYEVVAILLTHGHMDHIDGIRYFDCPIYIHEKELDFLADSTLSLYHMMNRQIPFSKADYHWILVRDEMEFDLIGYHFKVFHTPGHTKGSVVYAYGNKLFSGDTLFYLSAGRTDFPTGSSKDLKRSLQKIIQIFPDSTEVYPGHDQKTTIQFERKHNSYL